MNFCAVDATKGICRLSKQMINLDDAACPEIKVMPKCKNCKNFVEANDEGIGKCVWSRERRLGIFNIECNYL